MRGDIGLLIPDGVGVRNFVLGPFLREAAAVGRTRALHGIPEGLVDAYRGGYNGSVCWHPLLRFPDRPLPYTLRNSLSFAQMYWVDNYPMRLARSGRSRGSWRTRLSMRAAQTIGRLAAFPRGIRLLDRLHAASVQHLPEVQRYRELFREMQLGVLFCSHQRPPEILPPVLAARSLGIPTATFIFSWDNITTKGRIAAPFDHYLVWSEHMRRELLQYYPDVTGDRIHIVGTPQFDPYGDETLRWSREEFCCRIGADPAARLICYSGGDVSNSPEDPQHVRVLLELIRSGRIAGRPRVILRPCPVDAGARYADLRRDFPELIFAQPAWLHSDLRDWSKVIPSAEDVQFLANLVRHADLNVNFGSTMTLDFAIHDKPVVNLAFDVTSPPCYPMPMWDYLCQFDHYRPVIEFGAARFARSAGELADHVNAYLADPALDREGRRRFVELEVGVPVGQSSRRILEVLEKIGR